MKTILYSIVLSSVLVACNKGGDPAGPQAPAPIKNEVRLNFIGEETQDKYYGVNFGLSSVECRYDSANNNIRIVAYQFAEEQGEFKIKESLQLTDYAIDTNKSGFLKPNESDQVPSFIFLGNPMTLKYTDQSNCSTYYQVQGEEIRGNVLCSALQSEQNENTFVSVEFQCKNQSYLLFEIKQEML